MPVGKLLPRGAGSGEDVVEQELGEEQNAEDETLTACQRHAVVCCPLTSHLTTQSHQVPAGREGSGSTTV